MEKEFKFVGKGLSDEEREKFKTQKEDIEKESLLPFEAEMEKSEEIKKIIEFANKCLKEEFFKLGLKYVAIPLEKVHIFSAEGFEKTFLELEKAVKAFSSPYHQDGKIKLSANRAENFKVILHEMIHISSCHVYYAHVEEQEVSSYRFGYRNVNWQSGDDEHLHFEGFNEGLIDFIVTEIVQGKFDEIKEITKTTEENWQSVEWYHGEAEVIEAIMDKVAAMKGENWEKTYKKLKKGLFTGEMMHLRDIEKAFGPGSLKIFSKLEPVLDSKDTEAAAKFKKISEFFKTDDEAKREDLRKELLKT